jgi:ATP-dependent 26S proteasome regulatory subunit
MSENSNILNIPNGIIGNFSGYFLEKNISELIMSFYNNRRDKTVYNIIIGIIVLIFADIARTISMDFVKDQKKQISTELLEITKQINIFSVIKYCINIISYKCNDLKRLFSYIFQKKKQKINNNIIELTNQNNFVKWTIKPTILFLSNLIKYIEINKSNCKFDKFYEENIIIEKKQTNNKIIYSNISLKYQDLNIKIQEDLIYDGINNIQKNDFKFSRDIFDDLMDKYINMIDDNVVKNIILNEICSVEYYKQYQLFDNKINILKDLSTLKNKKITISNSNIILLLCYMNKLDEIHNNTIKSKKIILVMLLIQRTFFLNYPSNKYFEKLLILFNNKLNNKEKYNYYHSSDKNYILNKKFTDLFDYTVTESLMKDIVNLFFKIDSNDLDVNNTLNISNLDKLTLNIKIMDGIYDNNIIYNKINDFILHINNLSFEFENKKKIKLYFGKIEKKINRISKPNPEYLKYIEEKKKLLEENKDIKLERIIELIGTEPVKEIIEENIEKEVKLNFNNERYCSFDNLYLSNEQDNKMRKLFRSYVEDKEKLELLGIPNKLCLMLYGEPGTGKTTTIITTGSYFNRDIFYFSLKNISNSDLKLFFDYVNEKHSNQGIIVFEDFDAMTNVVSQRTNISTHTKNQIELIDELDDKLTLDFFLNILDGTLTADNSMVIMTTNHIEHIDKAIYRAGRVDALIEMKKSDHSQIKKIFKRFIGRDVDENVLKKIKEYEYEPAKIIFRLKDYIKMTDLSDEEILESFIN